MSWLGRLAARLTKSGRRKRTGPPGSLSDLTRIVEDHFGRDSVAEGVVASGLARQLVSQGDPTQARAFFEQAARIGLQQQWRNATLAVRWLGDLAVFFEEIGAYDEALPVLRQVVSLCSSHFGAGHPVTLAHRARLDRVLWLASIRGHA